MFILRKDFNQKLTQAEHRPYSPRACMPRGLNKTTVKQIQITVGINVVGATVCQLSSLHKILDFRLFLSSNYAV